MADFRLTQQAKADLDDIAVYTLENWGVQQALRYVDSLEQCCHLLANRPNVGATASDLAPDLRRHAHRAHVVYYLPEKNGVLIVRMLHERMDAPRHM